MLAERPCLRTFTLSYLPQRQAPPASAYTFNSKCITNVSAATDSVASCSARFQQSMSVDDDKPLHHRSEKTFHNLCLLGTTMPLDAAGWHW